MGNVYASQKAPTPPSDRISSALPLPPLQPEITKPDVASLSEKNIDNPGTIEELHKKCKGTRH